MHSKTSKSSALGRRSNRRDRGPGESDLSQASPVVPAPSNDPGADTRDSFQLVLRNNPANPRSESPAHSIGSEQYWHHPGASAYTHLPLEVGARQTRQSRYPAQNTLYLPRSDSGYNEIPRTPPPNREAFSIAIVAAKTFEASTVIGVFDEVFDVQYPKATGDVNSYTNGRIGSHYVVLAVLAAEGEVPAATSTAHIVRSFPNVSLALLVGVCGGTPVGEDEVPMLLGDVVIGTGVVTYTYGRRWPDKFRRKDNLEESLPRPTQKIRAFMATMRTVHYRACLAEETGRLLNELLKKRGFMEWGRPAPYKDLLFKPHYRHKHQRRGECGTCDQCAEDGDEVCDDALKAYCDTLGCDPAVADDRRPTRLPAIHFGKIASGSGVTSAIDRDQIAKEVARSRSGGDTVIAFEMEGAGTWDNIPTIIIKGVCDYADNHKNKIWQRYASAVAACCMKALLARWAITYSVVPQVAYAPQPEQDARRFHNSNQAVGGSY